jgi:hypothetical protein
VAIGKGSDAIARGGTYAEDSFISETYLGTPTKMNPRTRREEGDLHNAQPVDPLAGLTGKDRKKARKSLKNELKRNNRSGHGDDDVGTTEGGDENLDVRNSTALDDEGRSRLAAPRSTLTNLHDW